MMNKIVAAIERHQMLCRGDAVLAAISGGADSMALIYSLLELKDRYSLEIRAAHFNHKIRGEEAERDERFVAEQCKMLGVELLIGSADIPEIARRSGLGLEECGRRERYAFFERVANGSKVATAHSLSDCEETFLFNLARGASLRGLCSIPPVRGNIIRPLIDCSRAEIEEYCRENNIEYITDSTNLSDDYTRNRLRHRVVPELKNVNPAFDRAFGRCINGLREDEELLEALTAGVLERAETGDGFLTEALRGVHPSLRRRAVSKIIEKYTSAKPEARHIEAVCGIIEHGGDVQVASGVSFRAHAGRLMKVAEPAAEWACEMRLGNNILPYTTLNVEIYDENDEINIQKINKHLLAKALDYDKIIGKLFFSGLQEGDKFRCAGRGVTKQLRRVFSEMQIEPEERRRIALLRDEAGVVWVDGVGCAQRVSVEQGTKRLLLISRQSSE